MIKDFDSALNLELEQLSQSGLIRQIHSVESYCDSHIKINQLEYLSFASNDYLGLAKNQQIASSIEKALTKWKIGSGASHLVSGHSEIHQQLSKDLANFTGFSDCLTFSTGYMANLAVIPTLANRQTSIFADKLNHASLIDAVQLAKGIGAKTFRYRHLDLAHLQYLLEKSTSKQKIIVTDTVFSMDGDQADLFSLYKLAVKFNSWLVIDDAHGFGIFGDNGKGSINLYKLPTSSPIILMATFGKALGVSGAFVAGSEVLINLLRQKARSYIYTTATPSIIAAATRKSLEIVTHGDNLRTHLFSLINYLKKLLVNLPFKLMPSDSPIQPLLIGDVNKCNEIANRLWQQQIWLPAIRPPTVPNGQARLRISLSASHTFADLERLANALTHAC